MIGKPQGDFWGGVLWQAELDDAASKLWLEAILGDVREWRTCSEKRQSDSGVKICEPILGAAPEAIGMASLGAFQPTVWLVSF